MALQPARLEQPTDQGGHGPEHHHPEDDPHENHVCFEDAVGEELHPRLNPTHCDGTILPVSNTLRLDELRPHHTALVVENTTRTALLVERLMLALGPLGRLRGLLGRPALEPGEGMLLRPCRQVHTFFMTFPIDVLFLDRDGVVVALTPDLSPWRASPLCGAAYGVLELLSGEAQRTGTEVNDRLCFRLAPNV